MRLWLSMMFLLALAPSAMALMVDTPLKNPADEARAQALFHQFRCVVCQSESVADSPADVARDVRDTIRQGITLGKSDEQIIQGLVKSYGEFILMQPRFSEQNMLLWVMPLVLLLLGGVVLVRVFSRKRTSSQDGL